MEPPTSGCVLHFPQFSDSVRQYSCHMRCNPRTVFANRHQLLYNFIGCCWSFGWLCCRSVQWSQSNDFWILVFWAVLVNIYILLFVILVTGLFLKSTTSLLLLINYDSWICWILMKIIVKLTEKFKSRHKLKTLLGYTL